MIGRDVTPGKNSAGGVGNMINYEACDQWACRSSLPIAVTSFVRSLLSTDP